MKQSLAAKPGRHRFEDIQDDISDISESPDVDATLAVDHPERRPSTVSGSETQSKAKKKKERTKKSAEAERKPAEPVEENSSPSVSSEEPEAKPAKQRRRRKAKKQDTALVGLESDEE